MIEMNVVTIMLLMHGHRKKVLEEVDVELELLNLA